MTSPAMLIAMLTVLVRHAAPGTQAGFACARACLMRVSPGYMSAPLDPAELSVHHLSFRSQTAPPVLILMHVVMSDLQM